MLGKAVGHLESKVARSGPGGPPPSAKRRSTVPSRRCLPQAHEAPGDGHTSGRRRSIAPGGRRDGASAVAASSPGRAVALGSLIGFVLSCIAVTGGVAMSGGGLGSIGAGMLVGWFDGIPFGAMVGATVCLGGNPDK